jgi:hypothetical protein
MTSESNDDGANDTQSIDAAQGGAVGLVEAARSGNKGIGWLVHQLRARGINRETATHVSGEIAAARNILPEAVEKTVARVYRTEPLGAKHANVSVRKFDGKSLYHQEFPPVQFAIDGFLRPGFTMLACRPKFGKSFLALQIAIAVATGSKAFGRFDVLRPGKVLFYSLEDGPKRNQDRLRGLSPSDQALDNIRFVFEVQNKLLEGGMAEIEAEVAELKPVLLILDPFFMLAGTKQGRNFVRSEYEEMSYFRQLSAHHGIPVLLIHHTAKQESEYTLDSIIGSTGTTAPMDAWIIFKQKDGRTTLDIGGKDGEGRVYAVDREPNGGWRVLGEATEHVENPEHQDILRLLDDVGALKPSDIATKLKKNAANVRTWVHRMKSAGLLVPTSDGRYCRKPVFGRKTMDREPGDSEPDDFLKVA